ncbi:MAG: alpha/beta fold hydrolase [Planctomycetota bacterium]
MNTLTERLFVLADERDPLGTIRGRVAWPSGAERPLACVLLLHGFKGFMDWGFYPELTRRLVARDLVVVRINFSGSGHGADPELFTEPEAFYRNSPSRELADLARVRAALAGELRLPWLDLTRVALLGHSLGGGVALVHAAQRGDCRAVVGWAAVSDFRRFAPEVVELWRRQGYVEIPNLRTREIHRLGLDWLHDVERNVAELDIHAACARLDAPTLLVQGSEDEAVRPSEAESLLAAFTPGRARLARIPGANHTFQAVHPLQGVPATLEHALRVTTDFLVTHLA